MPNTHETLTSLFSDIADSIRAKTGENGTIVADEFPDAIDDIPTGVTPTGSVSITENGTYDVTEKASAIVNVASGDPYEMFNAICNGTVTYIKSNATGAIPLPSANNADYDNKLLQFFSMKNAYSRYGNYREVPSGVFFGMLSLKYCRLGERSAGVGQHLWNGCSSLKSLILQKETVFSVGSLNCLNNTGVSRGIGFLYVADSLKSAYQSATNWSTYATQIKGYSEAPSYSASTTYNIGDVCKYNGKFYGYCKEDLTSSTGNAPTGTTADNTYWEYVDDIEV